MRPEQWEEVLRHFEAASALEPSEREAYLARACPDAEIAAEVRRLLSAPSSVEFLEPPALDAPVHERDLGDFTLLEEIGRGGMGVVYRALQRPLKRIVAVKLLPATFALTARQIERFTREARAAAKLTHPNLVTVLTVGEDRGVHYFAMEFIDGKNLAEELARLRADLGAEDDQRAHLPSSRASDYFRSVAETVSQAADGLAFAHSHGVVHRDVKPSNLLLDPSGRVKLVDFGLARDEELGSLSRTGDVAGTPHYMSPEQARSQRERVDHRTDVYSLGVVLFELLTLQRPFEGQTVQEVLDNVLRRDPPRIRRLNPRVPRDLETICQKAMSRDRGDRYPDAGALRDDLQRFLSHEAITARAPGVVQQLGRRVRRYGKAILAGGLLLAGVGLGGAWAARAAERSEQRQRIATLHELEGEGDWSRLDDEVLVAARRTLTGLEREASPANAELRAGLGRRFEGLREEWFQEASRSIEEGRRAAPSDLLEGADDARILEGVLLMLRGRRVFPEEPRFERATRVDAFQARISIRAQDEQGDALSGSASFRLLDPVTGQPGGTIELGPLPVEGRSLAPGFYRFEVRSPGHRPREFTRLLARARVLPDILCTLRAPDPREGMVRIPGGRLFQPGERGYPLCPFTHEPVEVEAFWIDRAEVSFSQYRGFLAATGRPAPPEWVDLPADLSIEERPVVGVSWLDALAYAEWSGKRLVAHAEWELAARGPEGALFPFEEGDPLRGTVRGPARVSSGSAEDLRRCLEHTTDVLAPAEALGRNGLYHMFGNVWEWTESLGFDRDEAGTASSMPGVRVMLGGDYSAAERGHDLKVHRLWGPSAQYSNLEHGFRCARSDRD